MSSIQKLKPRNIPASNKKFIFSAIKDDKRIDGRSSKDFRNVSVGFGMEFGSCVVNLGGTRVMCNIAHQIAEPKPAKSCEGSLNIKVDLSATLIHSHEKLVEIMKIIEKNIKHSKCLDLESLCLVSGEKVYLLETDLIVMNDEGNLPECCSIALLASLSHFKRPDVSIVDDRIKIHSFADRHPIPLNILHYPFCTSFTFFDHSKFVCDPLQAEEQVCDGYLIIGANFYREITTIHISGKSAITKDMVIKCCQLAIDRSKYLTEFVKNAVEKDLLERAVEGATIGYVPLLKENSSVLCCHKQEEIRLDHVDEKYQDDEDIINIDYAQNTKMYRYASDTFGLGGGTETNWKFINDFKEVEDDEDGSIQNEVERNSDGPKTMRLATKPNKPSNHQEIVIDDCSSEEEIQVLDDETRKS